MKVLITGASGFIGQHLVVALRDANFEVRAAGRRHCDVDGVEWVFLPYVEHLDWKRVCKDVDVVVHLASIAHTRGTSFKKFQTINREASIALARDLRPDQSLIYVSSIRAVIGGCSPLEINEETPPAPSCEYGKMKLMAEEEIKIAHPNSCILRPVPVYGLGVKYNMKFLAFMSRSRLPLPIRQLDQKRSYLSVENFCSAIIFAINKQLCGTYQVSDPDTVTIPQLVSFFRDALCRPRWVFRVPFGAIAILGLFPFFKFVVQAAAGSLIARPSLLIKLGWNPPHKSTEDGVHRWATGNERNSLEVFAGQWRD